MADQTTTTPNGWKITTLGKVLYPVSDTFNFNGIERVHFLNTGDILEGKLLHKNLSSTKTLPGQAKKRFKLNDILYSEIRPANKRYMLVNFESSNSVASTKLMVLRTKENVDVKYIYTFITFRDILNQFQVIAESRSGTFPQITFDSISNIEVVLPPLPEQRAIAAVLSSLDDKIELLREQNKTLEATAQAIFKEWFVNFNFPGATGKMIDSELGEIPEGWRVVSFDEIMKFTPGTYIPKEEYEINGENFIYGSNSLMGNTNQKTHTGPIIVLAKIGTYCGAIRFSQDDCWINNNAGGIQGLNVSTALIFELLKHFDFSIVREGSGQPYINMSGLKMQKVAIPKDLNSEILKKISQSIDTIYLKIAGNQKQIQTLSRLRNTLLPKLMKGEVRVKGFKD